MIGAITSGPFLLPIKQPRRAIKAVFQHIHGDACGHSTKDLIEKLPYDDRMVYLKDAILLDKFYSRHAIRMVFLKGFPTTILRKRKRKRRPGRIQEFMDGVKVRFLNREEVLLRLVILGKRLLASRDNVIEVSLFGSLARGNYAPGSDTDIFILLRKDSRRFIDRIPEFLSHFSGVGIPIEVFPYTQEELDRIAERNFIRPVK